MEMPLLYRLAADLLLLLHFLWVVFIVLGLALIYLGRWRHWQWVRHPWFRLLHLMAILIVAAQAWLGLLCPLTRWEMALRARAGEAVYEGAFIAYWMGELLYYQAPEWVFTLGYSLFALLVGVSWWWIRPRPF